MEYIRKDQLIDNINRIADVVIKSDDGNRTRPYKHGGKKI